MLYNSGKLPENDIIAFYDHYDMLTAFVERNKRKARNDETQRR